jgi:hypothetical protein
MRAEVRELVPPPAPYLIGVPGQVNPFLSGREFRPWPLLLTDDHCRAAHRDLVRRSERLQHGIAHAGSREIVNQNRW